MPLSAACRLSDACDIGFLGTWQEYEAQTEVLSDERRYQIPTTMNSSMRRQIHSQQPLIQCIPGSSRNIRGVALHLLRSPEGSKVDWNMIVSYFLWLTAPIQTLYLCSTKTRKVLGNLNSLCRVVGVRSLKAVVNSKVRPSH